QNYTPQQYVKDPTSIGYEDSWLPVKRLHEGADPPTNTIEGYRPLPASSTLDYTPTDNFEIIGDGKPLLTNNSSSSINIPIYTNSWFFLTITILFAFLFLHLWADAGKEFFISVINKGTKPTWKVYLTWMIGIGAILGLMIWGQKMTLNK